MKTTNQLHHVIRTQTKDGNNIEIKISLDDDCKNGHNDFSITASVYKAPHWGGGNRDQFFISGGCCHDEILRARPDLKIFVDLHLNDVNGAPTYAISNGFYHLQNSTIEVVMSYLGVTKFEAEQLKKTSEDEQIFSYNILRMGLPQRWKGKALKAIELLEEMTGEKFKDDSKKLQVITPSKKDLDIIEDKIKAGFYTDGAIEARRDKAVKDARQAQFDDIKADLDKENKKHLDEYNVKFAILTFGLPIDNFIYYNHTNIGCFNWKDYDRKISAEQLNSFLEFIKTYKGNLPKDVTFGFDKK